MTRVGLEIFECFECKNSSVQMIYLSRSSFCGPYPEREYQKCPHCLRWACDLRLPRDRTARRRALKEREAEREREREAYRKAEREKEREASIKGSINSSTSQQNPLTDEELALEYARFKEELEAEEEALNARWSQELEMARQRRKSRQRRK